MPEIPVLFRFELELNSKLLSSSDPHQVTPPSDILSDICSDILSGILSNILPPEEVPYYHRA